MFIRVDQEPINACISHVRIELEFQLQAGTGCRLIKSFCQFNKTTITHYTIGIGNATPRRQRVKIRTMN